jgi:hypothetical protein
MNKVLLSIIAKFRPKEKTCVLSVRPEVLHQAIEAFPRSIGLWGSSSFELLQFDYTYFELQPTFGYTESRARFTPNLLGSLEELDGGGIKMELQTDTAASWKIATGILMLASIVQLVKAIAGSNQMEAFGTFGILLLIAVGLFIYKDNLEKVVIERFLQELAENLSRQGAVNISF